MTFLHWMHAFNLRGIAYKIVFINWTLYESMSETLIKFKITFLIYDSVSFEVPYNV